MSNRTDSAGWFSVSRKLFWSAVWAKPPAYVKVWVWLIGRANFVDQICKGHRCQRGEVVTCYREIIKGTAWVENRRRCSLILKQIRSILAWLSKEKMIQVNPLPGTMAGTGAGTWAYPGLRISIVNYDTYQDKNQNLGRDRGRDLGIDINNGRNNETPLNPPKGGDGVAGTKRTRTRKKSIPSYSALFEEAWAIFPKRSGSNPKASAWTWWCRWSEDGHTEDQLLTAVKAYAAEREGQDPQYHLLLRSFLSDHNDPGNPPFKAYLNHHQSAPQGPEYPDIDPELLAIAKKEADHG